MISVIVPCFGTPPERLASLLTSLASQTYPEMEVIVVDDGTSPSFGPSLSPSLPDDRFRVVANRGHTGPAGARNRGVEESRGELLFFTDSDCELAPGTLEAAVRALEADSLVAGNTVTRCRSAFARAVACLGFPGGGLLGFDRVWRVDASGHTTSVSGCNFAIRREAFEAIGRFDPSFPFAGGEDTVLGKTAVARGLTIRYEPEQLVYHAGRETWRSFVSWQITRGRGTFHVVRRLGSIRDFVKLRLWSLKNGLAAAGLQAPLVLVLFALLVVLQAFGHQLERSRSHA